MFRSLPSPTLLGAAVALAASPAIAQDAIPVTMSGEALAIVQSDLPQTVEGILDVVVFDVLGTGASTSESGSESLSALPAADLPPTGSATYAADVSGVVFSSQGVGELTGDATITADFADGSVAGAFRNMQSYYVLARGLEISAAARDWVDFDATGSIIEGSNLFSGTTATADGSRSGTFGGGIYGETANSVNGVFNLIGGGETAVGGFAGSVVE